MKDWLKRNQGHIITLLLALIASGALTIYSRYPQGEEQIKIVTPETAQMTSSETGNPLRVFVSGAVLHPDVYFLPARSVVKDAIAAAGGFANEAAIQKINMALELRDQQQIYVPFLQEETSATSAGASLESGDLESTFPLDINRAGLSEFQALPGIGPILAQRLIDYRLEHGSFADIEEIKEVPGIGDRIFDDIRNLIFVDN